MDFSVDAHDPLRADQHGRVEDGLAVGLQRPKDGIGAAGLAGPGHRLGNRPGNRLRHGPGLGQALETVTGRRTFGKDRKPGAGRRRLPQKRRHLFEIGVDLPQRHVHLDAGDLHFSSSAADFSSSGGAAG